MKDIRHPARFAFKTGAYKIASTLFPNQEKKIEIISDDHKRDV